MTSRTRLIFIIWTLAVLVLMVGGYWLFFIRGLSFDTTVPRREGPPEVSTMPAEILYSSAVYEEIRAYKALGETEKVRELFTGIQAMYAPGSAERSVIDYDYGFYLMFSTEDTETGVSILKELAADETADPLMRAFAMEALGRAALAFGSTPKTDVIFSTEPFAEMRASASTTYLATLKIFEAATAIQPTAIAALRIAQSHSYALHNRGDMMPEEEKQIHREAYETYMQMADAQENLIAGKVAFNQYLADFYVTKAYTLSLMFFADELYVGSEQVEDFYRKGIALAQGSEQVFALFNYAAFLSRAESGTPAEVDALVGQIERIPAVSRRLFNANMANALENQRGAYEDIVRLMAYSPAFKAYVENFTDIDAGS